MRIHRNTMALWKRSVLHGVLVYCLWPDSPCNALFQRSLYIFQRSLYIFQRSLVGHQISYRESELLDFQNTAVFILVCINRCRGYLNTLALIPVYHSIMWAFLVQSVSNISDISDRIAFMAMLVLMIAHAADHEQSVRSFFVHRRILDHLFGVAELVALIGPGVYRPQRPIRPTEGI